MKTQRFAWLNTTEKNLLSINQNRSYLPFITYNNEKYYDIEYINDCKNTKYS